MAKKKRKVSEAKEIPPGFKLRHTLRGHTHEIWEIAWSPDGRFLASGSSDKTARVWDIETGTLRTRLGHSSAVVAIAWPPDGQLIVTGCNQGFARIWDWQAAKPVQSFAGYSANSNLAWSPDGRHLAAAFDDHAIIIWRVETGTRQTLLRGHRANVFGLAWSSDGTMLASASGDGTARIWYPRALRVHRILESHGETVTSVAWSPDGKLLASTSNYPIIRLRSPETGREVRLLEGHSGTVVHAVFSSDFKLLVSKSNDDTVRTWRCDTWESVAVLKEYCSAFAYGLAIHPTLPILATVGSKEQGGPGTVIRIWDLDYSVLLGDEIVSESEHYRNAKVVLVGDTGVGKSGLALVLTGKDFEPTDSTHGRHVHTFDEQKEERKNLPTETRETLLWDLAGQPGYRLVHQMHLNEVAVALVVFDARSETDPLTGVKHWERALRQAQKRQGDAAVPLTKYLVGARADCGGVPVSKERIEKIKQEMGFEAYLETSAKESWKIAELAKLIRNAIDWKALPQVTSTELFQNIKQFILDEKKAGRLFCTADDLYDAFYKANSDIDDVGLRDKFNTCLTRLENRDLVKCLSFGDFVLLQPELLDAYASAMINAARKEPHQMGSILEEVALAGQFEMPKGERVPDKEQEKLLLIPTVKELVDSDLALREHADDGTHLVFPSQYIRDWPEAPDPEGKAVVINFEGPIQHIYATLAVRLAHSGSFSTDREEMWRNAAKFRAKDGGVCGIYLREFSEATGQFTLFYTENAKPETRFRFEEYILAHLHRRAIGDTVEIKHLFVCQSCGEPVPERYVEGRLKRGLGFIECGVCGTGVILVDRRGELAKIYPSNVREMDESADRSRDLNSATMTLRGKIESNDFDVFLCHNSKDKPAVKEIGEELKKHGILPWLDEWNLQPGLSWQKALESQIENIKCAAVFVGKSGVGPWEREELEGILLEFVGREEPCPVIPVVLKGCKKRPKLPLFLKTRTWVDFRKSDPDPLKQLIWGITGKREIM